MAATGAVALQTTTKTKLSESMAIGFNSSEAFEGGNLEEK
jgi:hypothetical protein